MGVTETGHSIILETESGSSAEIYLFGAHVTSWKQAGEEKLFVSEKTKLDGTTPIRGGVPIVFPIFGPPQSSYPAPYAALPQHGFVRTQTWSLEHIVMDRPEGVSVRLAAPAPPSSFPHSYKLTYVVTLSAHQLSTDVHVENTSDKEDFIFHALLHNYLAVPDARKIKIGGLDKGIEYRDKVKGETLTWEGGDLTITGETDRVYKNVPSKELKLDYGNGTGLNVRMRGFEDCVTWNPDSAAHKIADMQEGGAAKYVCIEPGYVHDFKTLKPGEEFIGQQVFSSY